MCHLTHLMLRGVLPQSTLLQEATNIATKATINSSTSASILNSNLPDKSERWYNKILEIASSMTVNEIYLVPWERQIGFLHLLEQTVRLIGFGISNEVGVLLKVVLAMLGGSQVGAWKGKIDGDKDENGDRDGDEDEDEDKKYLRKKTKMINYDKNDENVHEMDVEDDVEDQEGDEEEKEEEEVDGVIDSKRTSGYHRNLNQSSKVRSLSLLRLSEIVHQFHSTFSFPSIRKELLSPLGKLIPALPSAITGSSKPPGLLRLLNAFVRYDETISVLILAEKKEVLVPIEISVTSEKSKKQNNLSKKKNNTGESVLLLENIHQTKEIDEGEKEKEEKEEEEMRIQTDEIVETLIKCVAARAEFEVSRMVMDSLSVLLEREDGRAILPHAELIIKCFSKRFVGPDFDDSPGVSAQLKLSEMRIAPTGSVKQGK